MEMQHEHQTNTMDHSKMMYKKFALMIVLSFIAMYILMYAMVDRLSNVVFNINQFYMAALMTMPMIVLELSIMTTMYKNKKLNAILISAGTIGLVVFFLCIHQQAGVRDKQFLKSMVPHHAAAVLMVEQANISDPEVKKLAEGIITSQKKEIEQMKKKIEELDN